MLLMLYVCIYTPYEIAFLKISVTMLLIGNLVDVFFAIDMVVNFFSAYEIENGREETNLRKIVLSYLKLWFWIDLIATIPSQFTDMVFNVLELSQSNDHNGN